MASSPSIYLSAPTSPTSYDKTRSMEYYYSAPPSPRRTEEKQQESDFPSSVFDDFEFETSKKFDYTTPIVGDDNDDDNDDDLSRHERGDSLHAIAFADELFVNGLVMPLKLPPRLQYDSDLSFSQKSPNLSPKSPRTVCKLPFARKNIWNDDFDPFKVALEKVREEKRSSYHRRSMSQHLPFGIMSKSYSTIDRCDQEKHSRNSPEEVLRPSFSGPLVSVRSPPKSPTLKPSCSGPLDFKGSTYARWARAQIQEGALSPQKSPRRFLFGHRVRPVKAEHDCLEGSVEVKGVKDKCGKGKEESKVQKLKGVMLKYASFGRENSGFNQTKIGLEPRKAGYFSRLSFKFKGNGNGSVKKKSVHGDEKMAVVEYKAKPSLGLCLGYGVASPGNMK